MALNKQKGNMYGFVTHTWNPIKGICPHGCEYCYMRGRVQSYPHLDEKELRVDLGSGNTIFVGSSCDMWAAEIPEEWIREQSNAAWNIRETRISSSLRIRVGFRGICVIYLKM
jgi:DNA repair photolyase